MSEANVSSPVPRTPAFNMIRTLAGIAMLSGLLVVLVFQWTKPIIAENQRIATEKAVFQVVPGAVTRKDFVVSGDSLVVAAEGAEGAIVYAAYDADGNLKGLALPAAAQGYQDVIRLLYGFDPECACIRNIKVLKMTETPGLGDKIATDAEFQRNFEALDARLGPDGMGLAHTIETVKHGTKTEPWQIDAISGATVSANAVGKALNASAQQFLPIVMNSLDVLRGDAP